MASLMQSTIFPVRDTHKTYEMSSRARPPSSSDISGITGSAWSNIPNIWQTSTHERANNTSGNTAAVSPTRGDSLTAPKSPHDPLIPGSLESVPISKPYPPRRTKSPTAPAQTSPGRSSYTTQSPPRQRLTGLLGAHTTSSKMPHFGTATLLNGSAPDVDPSMQSTYASMRAGQNRFQTINVGGIDEFVPSNQQSVHRSRPSNSRFENEWTTSFGHLVSPYNVNSQSFIPSRYNDHNIFEQQGNDHPGARVQNSDSTRHVEETQNQGHNLNSTSGFSAWATSQDQSLSSALINLKLENAQRQFPYQSSGEIQRHGRMQEQAYNDAYLGHNAAHNESADAQEIKDVEFATPQLSYQYPNLNVNAFSGTKPVPSSASMAMYTPSYTPPTAPGSRHSNSGSGTSTRASSQSVDTRFGGFDAGSAFFPGRQGPLFSHHGSGGIEYHMPGSNPYNPLLSATQHRPVRSLEGHSQHLTSTEARIQQEKEQNLSPLIKDFRANYKAKRYELKDAYNHIVEFSGDQHGSRFIQAKLETANGEEKEKVFAEIQENALQLMTDIFGNYVIQKMFEHGTQAQKKILANQMKGRVYYLTTQVYGCRVVQKALEHVLTDQQASMVKELDGNILGIVENQNGNHVIQKAIERVPSEHIQFIFDAHVGHVVRLSRHNYGCRVIQRILEYGPPPVKRAVLGELREAIPILIEDQFGNYVIQHIIRNGEQVDRRMVVTLVQQQLLHFSKHKFASNVVEAAIECAEDSQRQSILQALTTGVDVHGQSQVYGLIRDQYGNYVIQKVLAKLQGAALNDLIVEIQHHLVNLRKISHGKQVSAMEKALADAIATLGPQYRGHISAISTADTDIESRSSMFAGDLSRYRDQLHPSRALRSRNDHTSNYT